MCENSSIGKKRIAFKFFCVMVLIALTLTFAGSAHAFNRLRGVVRDGSIESVPGLEFENLVYFWDRVMVSVINTYPQNVRFGGTMVFLDRRGRHLARANLLPQYIAGQNSRRYTARFVEGSGEAARRASKIIWDFVTKERGVHHVAPLPPSLITRPHRAPVVAPARPARPDLENDADFK